MDNKSEMIRVEGLTRTYRLGQRKVHALKGIDLQIKRGTFVAMRGRSGSGKTTLLNCIGGLDKPTTGRIWIAGRDVGRLPERELVKLHRQTIGFIFQSHALLPAYSAGENIDLMLRLAGWSRKQRHPRIEEVLDLVGLRGWIDHRPFEMSGGQQQRVAIARALASQPPLIIADEPTGELDIATSANILQLLTDVTKELQTTVIVATHDPLVEGYAKTILDLQDGKISVPNMVTESA